MTLIMDNHSQDGCKGMEKPMEKPMEERGVFKIGELEKLKNAMR